MRSHGRSALNQSARGNLDPAPVAVQWEYGQGK
jgi:hypothetical protein